MRFYIILIQSVILLTSSCSFSISHPSFKDVLNIEAKIVSPHTTQGKRNTVFDEILLEALDTAEMPSDYARISFLKATDMPVMSSGVSTEIYVSEIFIYYFDKNLITKTDLQLYFLHEIAHKILNHPYLLVAQPYILFGYIEPSLNDVFSLMHITALKQLGLIKRTDNQPIKPIDYIRASQAINSKQNTQLKESNDFAKIPFLGYLYTDEMECSADEYVVTLLSKKKNIHISRYSQALEKMKAIYELYPEILSGTISNKIEKRLNHINHITNR